MALLLKCQLWQKSHGHGAKNEGWWYPKCCGCSWWKCGSLVMMGRHHSSVATVTFTTTITDTPVCPLVASQVQSKSNQWRFRHARQVVLLRRWRRSIRSAWCNVCCVWYLCTERQTKSGTLLMLRHLPNEVQVHMDDVRTKIRRNFSSVLEKMNHGRTVRSMGKRPKEIRKTLRVPDTGT